MINDCLTSDERETLSNRRKKLISKIEQMSFISQRLEELGHPKNLSDLYEENKHQVGEARSEINILDKVLAWEFPSVAQLDDRRAKIDRRAFRLYTALIASLGEALSEGRIDTTEIAYLARDAEADFTQSGLPSDPNLLQFEGIETVFGSFRVDGDELWWQQEGGGAVIVANFNDHYQAVDAARELDERLKGYPVLKK